MFIRRVGPLSWLLDLNHMTRVPCFSPSQLEAACKVLADTINGLKGNEIGYILSEISVEDTDPTATKWKRLFNALANKQNRHQVGNHLIMFINRAMTPFRYTSSQELFAWRQNELNVVLAFSGYRVREDGKVVHTTVESTLAGAKARAGRLKALLEARSTHAEVFKYCRAELLQENYFHAVLEAVKGLAQRLRDLSGLGSDGAELVNTALSTKTPIVALNSLSTETEISEGINSGTPLEFKISQRSQCWCHKELRVRFSSDVCWLSKAKTKTGMHCGQNHKVWKYFTCFSVLRLC